MTSFFSSWTTRTFVGAIDGLRPRAKEFFNFILTTDALRQIRELAF